jgi:hypothetical protein
MERIERKMVVDKEKIQAKTTTRRRVFWSPICLVTWK